MLICEVDRESPVTVLRINGGLRLGVVPQIRSTLLKCLAECPAALIVDLTAATIDSPITLNVFGAVVHRAADWPPVPLILVAAPAGVGDEQPAVVRRACRPWRIPVCDSFTDALAFALHAPPPIRRARQTFRPATMALGAARAMVAESCVSWGISEQTLPAELVMTELVGNAVQHARTDLEAAIILRSDLLHLTVRDGCPDPPRISPAPPPPAASPGRGLLLINEFATAWGHVPLETGKVVWATLRV
jgi:hypothetical protein